MRRFLAAISSRHTCFPNEIVGLSPLTCYQIPRVDANARMHAYSGGIIIKLRQVHVCPEPAHHSSLDIKGK